MGSVNIEWLAAWFADRMARHIEEFMDAYWFRRAIKRAREYQGKWL